MVRKDVRTLKQQAEDNVASLNAYRAHGEGLDDHIGHLERKLAEIEQDNRDLS